MSGWLIFGLGVGVGVLLTPLTVLAFAALLDAQKPSRWWIFDHETVDEDGDSILHEHPYAQSRWLIDTLARWHFTHVARSRCEHQRSAVLVSR